MSNFIKSKCQEIQKLLREGDISSATKVINKVKCYDSYRNNIWLLALEDFSRIYEKRAPKVAIKKMEAFYSAFIGLSEAEDIVYNSILNSTPLSLIRLGDGEGSLLANDTMREEYPHGYDWGLNFNLDIWFGKDRCFTQTDFMDDVYADFTRSLSNSDIIGVPENKRLRRVYKNSPRGYAGCLAVVDYVMDQLCLDNKYIGDCNLHYQLADSGFLDKILSITKSCAVVTCHKKLSTSLEEEYGINEVDEYLIPEEKNNSYNFGNNSSQVHYPDVYEEMKRKLNPKFTGQVFFVAAGPLGKIYCSIIKERGGIAIDIGSIADLWLGFHSRPAHRKAGPERMNRFLLGSQAGTFRS